MRQRLDEKDKDLRRIKEDSQNRSNRADNEIEMIKIQNKNELELIQEKVATAMNKKIPKKINVIIWYQKYLPSLTLSRLIVFTPEMLKHLDQ